MDEPEPGPDGVAHTDARVPAGSGARGGERRVDPFGLISGGEGIITGTVVCAAVIAYGAGHVDSTAQLSIAIFGTVLVYWLAHLHARTLGASVTHGHHPLTALRLAVQETWPIGVGACGTVEARTDRGGGCTPVREDASVMHVNADSFFASVETRQKPSLARTPVLVGGTGPRGVVATANYEARAFGCHSAMPMSQARVLCPSATVLTPRFPAYAAHSALIMDTLRELSPLVQPVSLDEAFVDLAAGPFADDPAAGADLARRLVYNGSGLVVSVGLGRSKLIAKLASDAEKPHGFTLVPPEIEDEFPTRQGSERLTKSAPPSRCQVTDGRRVTLKSWPPSRMLVGIRDGSE